MTMASTATSTIAVLATLDTKGHEAQYLREQLGRLGSAALVVDIGVGANWDEAH